jgi:hypothetical protein
MGLSKEAVDHVVDLINDFLGSGCFTRKLSINNEKSTVLIMKTNPPEDCKIRSKTHSDSGTCRTPIPEHVAQ